jgi:hypothetical protein
MKTLALIAGSAIAGSAMSAPAQAMFIQTVGPVSFSTEATSPTPTNIPPSIPIPGFSASAPSNLVSWRVVLKNTKFQDDLAIVNTGLSNLSNPFTVEASPTFTFSDPSQTSAGTQAQIAVTPSTIGPSLSFITSTASGPYSGFFGAKSVVGNAPVQAYFVAAPVINDYFVSYTVKFSPIFGGPATVNPVTFSGDLYVEYEYVPGPLPLLGAGAAFGWSRRMRKRIAKRA